LRKGVQQAPGAGGWRAAPAPHLQARSGRYAPLPHELAQVIDQRILGDLISYQNDGKFGVFIVGNVEKA